MTGRRRGLGCAGLAVCMLAFVPALGAAPAGNNIIRFGGAASNAQKRAIAPPEAGNPVSLVAKARARADFVSAADWCWESKVRLDGGEYSRLDLPGQAAGGVIGTPRLPYHGEFVRVPDGAGVRLVIDDVTWADVPGAFSVAPVQPPELDAVDAPPAAFAKDAAAYAASDWTPSAPVRLADRMRIRGREFVYVVYAPVAYNPAASALRAATRVQWHLEFDLPPGGAPAPRADLVGQAAFAQIFDTTLDATSPDAFAATGVAATGVAATATSEQSDAGADYLIITADQYFTRLSPLAQLKTQMGLTVRRVNLSTITSTGDANAISDYIRNAYQTWTTRPTYLLLVGDAEDLPPHDVRAHPSRDGMPATDLYYAAVDGNDIFPDLFCGRLTCATLDECTAIVGKIVNHQTAPDPDAAYRNSVLMAGFFQDVKKKPDGTYSTPDGIESRIFIETAEAGKDYYTSIGQTVHTAYYAESDITPRYYDPNGTQLHTPGSAYFGTQTYLTRYDAWQAVLARLRGGVWLAQYRGHGAVEGWADPYFMRSDVAGLGNGARLPFVLSVTCQTGWFDATNGRSLCEALLGQSGGGAVGVVGSTRNSASGWNDWFIHGCHESMFPGYLEALSGMTGYLPGLTYGDNSVHRGSRLGQVLNFAKMVMYDTVANGQEDARNQFEILTLFGDPHMHVQPWNDSGIRATHPAILSAVHAEFTITATYPAGAPVVGATVHLTSTAGDDLTYTTDAAGRAAVVIEPLARDRMTVEVSKAGSIPYVGTITLVPQPLNVSHPDTVSAITGGFVVNVYRDITEPLAGATVLASSAEGDHQERVTDSAGQAVFAFIPLSITTMDITVTARAYTTYHGTIRMIPGSLTVEHASEIDEGRGPFNVTVRTGGAPMQAARVSVSTGGVAWAELLTAGDGVARFPMAPLGAQSLSIRTTARGYTPVNTSARTVTGDFVWSSLPSTLDRGGPEPVRVTLTSALDGTSVITGYQGTASLEVLTAPQPPPPVVITDCRRYGEQSQVVLQCVRPSGNISLYGWMLVRNGSKTDIDAVHPDIKDPAISITALLDMVFYRPNASTGSVEYWEGLSSWGTADPGWVMLLDDETNIVDFVAWGWDAETIASMAPVIRGRSVPVGAQWYGDGVPLVDAIVISRDRVEFPQDRNVAEDFVATMGGGAQSRFDEPFVGYGARLASVPTSIGPFVAGVWTGTVSVLELGSNALFRAQDTPRAGDSEGFDIIQAPHSQYGFDAFNTQQLWNASFAVTVRAQDRNGTAYTDFNGSARLYGYADATAEQVLITEVGVSAASANFVELQNVSKTAANTRNWRLVVGDVPGNASAFDPTVVTLPDSVAASALLTGVENRRPLPGTLGFPTSVGWANGEPGWAMLLDASYGIVDFVAWGWPEADITNMEVRVDGHTVRVGSAWVGKGMSYMPSRYVGSLQRKGSVDYNRAADFSWWVSSRGAQNTWLDFPLTDARRPIPVVPTTLGPFVDGVWSDGVAVQEDVDAMYFEVRDALGNAGESARFNVRYLGPITVTVPPLVTEGDGVLTGQGTVSVEAAPAVSLSVTLRSSDTTEVTVPATVTILGRTTSRTFDITVVNDTLVDFTQDARITATGRGYGTGTGRIGVRDNETCGVTLTVPASTHEGAGSLGNVGRIDLSANAGQDTTFTIASTDTSELQVPASVTIASGRNRASFNITAVDDAVADGEQTVRIKVSPDDLLFKTGTVVVADNDAHHFGFRPIGNVQTACVPFQVTIEALDAGDRVVTAYAGTPDLGLTDGSSGYRMEPAEAGGFVNGEWSGSVKVLLPCRRVNLTADDGLGRGESERFDVTHGPLTHFAWTPFPTGTVHAGAWLPARVQACDTNGFPVTSFRGPARIEVTQHDRARPVRLLTFVRYAQMDRAYRNARAAIDAHFPHVEETLTTTTDQTDLATELGRNDVFLLLAQENAPGGQLASLGGEWAKVLSGFVEAGGVVIACSRYGDEHVLLREAGLANLLREGVGGKESPYIAVVTVATNRLTTGVAGRFSGLDLAGYSSAECEPIVRSATNRVPVVMHRALGAGHVVMLGNGFAEPNGDFDRLLANAVRLGLHRVPRTVAFAPEQTGPFADGVWTGVVQVVDEGLDTQVDADDQDGHRGSIGLFDVTPLSLRGFRTDAEGRMVLEWDSAGITPYTIGHTEGGPDREFLPLESNVMASPPMNTFTGKFDETYPHYYRLRVPAR